MRTVRRHLRRGVTAWLVCHVLAFSALVPRDCCAAHAHARHPGAAEAAPCHEEAAPAPGAHCEMGAEDGAACPMHAGSGATEAECVMTGVCNAPGAALAAVLMQAAVPALPFTLTPALATTPTPRALPVTLVSLLLSPASPPPRL